MNKLITIPLLFFACIFMTSCLNNDEPKDVVKEIRMEVSAETGVTYHWGDGNQEHPIECMLVKLPDNSPLSDKVRLVRNESSGPMFKNVVPENEYRHIVENMVSGEEIQYVMVLANVHKLGLQKVQFTIRKS